MSEQFYEDVCTLTDDEIKAAWESVPKFCVEGGSMVESFHCHFEFRMDPRVWQWNDLSGASRVDVKIDTPALYYAAVWYGNKVQEARPH